MGSAETLYKKEFRALLLVREQYYKDLYQSYNPKFGYDVCKIAGSRFGTKCSLETKMKMSISHEGKCHSEETRAKIGFAIIGNKNGRGIRSIETRQKISISRKGTHHSEETKQKMRLSQMGNKNARKFH
jgi:hypothetical protein